MRTVISLTVVLLVLAIAPGAALAQLHLGGQASLALERSGEGGSDSAPGVGVRAALGLPGIPLEVHGSVDYFFTDCDPIDCSFWEANANAIFRVPVTGSPLRPYLGGGLNYQKFSGEDLLPDADGTGINLLGGVELGATPLVRPFVEARYEIIDGLENQLVLTAGIIL